MAMTDNILTVARAYSAVRKQSIARISTLVFNDGKKLDLIAKGADLHTAKYEQAMAWFSASWPDGAAWPEDVPRPEEPADPAKESA